MVKATTKWWRKLGQRKICLGVFVVVGLLGVLICSYGYAAKSTNLLISGRAKMAGDYDVQNVGVRVASQTANAYEAYNAEFEAHTVSLHPQVTGKNNNITYAVETCNYSADQTYELVGLEQPATALGSLSSKISKIEVGTNLVLGTKLAPGECVEGEISFTQTKDAETIGALTLDYTWEKYDGTPFAISYMQEMTPQVCAATSERETKQLIDQRDGHKYWVTKMHDGRCWMAQDMDYDVGGGARKLTEAQVRNLEWDTDANSSPAQYYYRGDNDQGHSSAGSYYSYVAATGVCPTGWRLATGGPGSEWDKLLDVAGLNNVSDRTAWIGAAGRAPFYLQLTGYAGHETLGFNGWGTNRITWTGTRDSRRANSTISVGFGSEYPDIKYDIDYPDANYYGLPVRCIAKTGTETETKDLFAIDTMQEMTTEVCNAAQVNDAKQLRDTRDNKRYWVTKLKDGKCWMTQNLDYDGGGTRFVKGGNLSAWVKTLKATSAQYLYVGDNSKGRESDGSYYSHRAALNVCPAGWRLPTSGAGGDYDTLFGGNVLGTDVVTKIATVQKEPYYFRLVGYANETGLVNYGTEGAYQASRKPGDSRLLVLDFQTGNSTFQTAANIDEYSPGESVRCVAGDPVAEPQDLFSVNTMQEVTKQVCMNTTLRDTAAETYLTDTRDGHKYWVTRMAKDNNCWMLQNLDYDGGGTRYTSSNVSGWKTSGTPTQYYYKGDWAQGKSSDGSMYSWKSATTVCPTNWRLPTGGTSGEQVALVSGIPSSATGVATLNRAPYYLGLHGCVNNTGWIVKGGEGYWWASTGSSGKAYLLYITKTRVTPALYDGAFWGASVRCMIPGK